MSGDEHTPKDPGNDEQLVSLAKAGDTRSFGILVERYKERAVRIAFSYTRNFDDAKDVAQEAFIKAHGSLGRFDERSRFYTWFFRILVNQSIDFIRKRREIPSSDSPIFETLTGPQADTGDGVPDETLRLKLEQLVEGLAPQQKTVILLTYFHEMTGAEAAEVMGLSENTVRATKFQALEKLRKQLRTLKEASHG